MEAACFCVLLQSCHEFSHRLKAVIWLFFEGLHNGLAYLLRQSRRKLARIRRGLLQVAEQHLADTALERAIAGQQLKEHHTKRIDVGPVIDRAGSHDLLGRHVIDCANCAAAGEGGLHRLGFGNAEVHLDQLLVGGAEHDVGGLEIAMHQAARMGILQRGGQFDQPRANFIH